MLFRRGHKSQDALSWHQLFSAVDEDGSGLITYDELEQARSRQIDSDGF